MRLYLEAFEGPAQGKKFSLTSRTSFGRHGADILINDSKLSGIHAFFEVNKHKEWVLVDNESRNGVWINGHKEIKAVLREGDVIRLGESQFNCRFLEISELRFSEEFQGWVQGMVKQAQNRPHYVSEVKPEMRLKVIQGVQLGETWDIFYGPRHAGHESLDICLFDEKAPKDTFEIQVKGKYAYFHTKHERLVRVNNDSVASKQFEPGDVISFGDSQILVEFDEGHGFRS
ncbi:MAG: FHA domain-containing protein [Pseudomonadota bacterium]